MRVKKSLKDKARKYKIDPSKTVRSALEDEIRKREEELTQALSEIRSYCKIFRTRKL